jgi:uncharacterized membrane protein
MPVPRPFSSAARRLVGLVTAALLVSVGLAPAAHSAPPSGSRAPAYAATELTTTTGQTFLPSPVGNPVNERGVVAGSTTVDGIQRAAVFQLRTRTMRVLKAYRGRATWASDVNRTGQVAGQVADGSGTRAFVWTTGTGAVLTLPAAGFASSSTRAINDRGVVVGKVGTTTGDRASVWDLRTGRRVLLAMDEAVGVNEQGLVVGIRYGLGDGNLALVWTPSTRRLQTLRPLTGDDSAEPSDINDAGRVVGISYSLERDDLVTAPVLWRSRTARPCALSAVQGNGFARALDDRGRVVGSEVSYSLRTHRAVLWTGCGGTGTTLAAPADSYALPTGINDLGQVVGRTGDRGYRWTPTA